MEKKDIFNFYGFDENVGSLQPYRDFFIKSWCENIPVIQWFLNFQTYEKETKIVEIGVQGGGSLLRTFDLIENKNCKLYGIDVWEDCFNHDGINGLSNDFWTDASANRMVQLFKEMRENIENILKKYDHKRQVQIFKTSSKNEDLLSMFKKETVDLLYVDGDHSFRGCYLDLVNWYPKVKKGGLVLIDDYYSFNTVKVAVDQFCQEESIEIYHTHESQFYFIKR